MAAATIAKLGATTCLAYEDQTTPGTYLPIEGALTIPEIGDASVSYVDVTPICATDKEKIVGDSEPPEFEIEFNDVPGDSVYEDFVDLAKAQATEISIQVTYTNGRIATFLTNLAGFKVPSPERETQIKAVIFGTITGGITWTMTA